MLTCLSEWARALVAALSVGAFAGAAGLRVASVANLLALAAAET